LSSSQAACTASRMPGATPVVSGSVVSIRPAASVVPAQLIRNGAHQWQPASAGSTGASDAPKPRCSGPGGAVCGSTPIQCSTSPALPAVVGGAPVTTNFAVPPTCGPTESFQRSSVGSARVVQLPSPTVTA